MFEPGSPRLTQIDGVEIEAPLEGTLLVITNDDQPASSARSARSSAATASNIASFALGRGRGGAVGVVNLDADGAQD